MRDSKSWSLLKGRNAQRPGVELVSSNGYHYSWTWSGIHFVMLNISPATQHALEFLAHDLERNVGKTGKPVILLQHYSLNAGKWLSQPQLDALYNVVRDYNILCVMHGHTHHAKTYKWHDIDVLDDGSLKKETDKKGKPGFMVVRIEGDDFIAVRRQADGEWGKVIFRKKFVRTAPDMVGK